MKVLLSASEVAPIIKLGGLGDVIGSLPKALSEIGVECDVIVPYFPFAKVDPNITNRILEISVPYAGGVESVEIFKTTLPESNVDVLLIKNDTYFHSHSATWKMTNEEEVVLFSFFDRAVVEYIKASYNTYDLVHCHDWHTGLITHLLADELESERPATLFTIHNLLYQGVGEPGVVRNVGIVPGEHMLVDWDVADGDLNMIQQGITSADFVSTVSPTYMAEIQTEEFGGGLNDILTARAARLAGILNGLDYASLPRNYDISTYKNAKLAAKLALQQELGIQVDATIPLFTFVGRLDPHQKGIDLIYDILPKLLQLQAQFVLLGSGSSEWENKFLEFTRLADNRHAISVTVAFDRVLSQKIYEAGDFLLVPSRYEPCGLIQMIAMWYGNLPIVRATGGLKDTVKDRQNGFVFDNYSAHDLFDAVSRATNAYNGHELDPLITNALQENYGWDRSAEEYKSLYTKIIQLRERAV